jgi:hypothetical protein
MAMSVGRVNSSGCGGCAAPHASHAAAHTTNV